MVITSQDNAKVKEIIKLFDKKQRKVSGKYVIEGERLVRDAIKHNACICDVFVKQSVADRFDFDGQIAVADKIFDKISDTVTTQGVLAVVKQADTALATPHGNCLVLDGLQDPGNVGTLIRTAASCGFGDVYAVNCVDLFSPKVVRSAMSAHFCVKLHQCESISDVFDLLKDTTIVCADMGGENVFDKTFHGNVALVLGNEGNGLSEYSRQNANLTVSLPMENQFESLNVAIAGSVIMYHIYANKFNK